MDLSRLLGGGCAFQTNISVFASATGLLLSGAMLGRTPSSGASSGVWVITVPSTTAANKDAIGCLAISDAFAVANKENLANNASGFHIDTSDNIPNRGTAAGYDYLPAVINPDAVYYALYDQTSANVVQT